MLGAETPNNSLLMGILCPLLSCSQGFPHRVSLGMFSLKLLQRCCCALHSSSLSPSIPSVICNCFVYASLKGCRAVHSCSPEHGRCSGPWGAPVLLCSPRAASSVPQGHREVTPSTGEGSTEHPENSHEKLIPFCFGTKIQLLIKNSTILSQFISNNLFLSFMKSRAL